MSDIKTTASQQAAQPPVQPVSATRSGALSGIFGFKKGGPQQLDISLFNRGLMVIIVALVIYFITGFSRSWTDLKKLSAREFSVNPAGSADAGFKEIPALKGVPYYLGKVRSRDIFHRKDLEKDMFNEPVFSNKMAEMTVYLKLVGISMSSNPDAMIEDTNLQRTFFVKVGSRIGELQVESITKDKVVLKYNKELFELK